MNLSRGTLQRRRVVTDLATPLDRALETELTGYVRLRSQDELLLDGEGTGVLTFTDGVPVLAYHTGTDRGGADALRDIAVAGPYRVTLYALEDSSLAAAHEEPTLRVDPGAPADHLAGDTDLAERTCERAEAVGLQQEPTTDSDPVASFLDDEGRIADVQAAARREAKRRATDWGFDIE